MPLNYYLILERRPASFDISPIITINGHIQRRHDSRSYNDDRCSCKRPRKTTSNYYVYLILFLLQNLISILSKRAMADLSLVKSMIIFLFIGLFGGGVNLGRDARTCRHHLLRGWDRSCKRPHAPCKICSKLQLTSN